LGRRAAEHGGDFTIEHAYSGGTLLRWSAPLR
jgi:signal transduction histidine kinase